MSRPFIFTPMLFGFSLIVTSFFVSNAAHAGFVVNIYDTGTAISSLDDAIVQTLIAGNPTTTGQYNVIDFSDQGNGTAFPIGNPETFVATAEGSFEITQAGNYTFQAFHDDGVRVSINGTQVVNSPLPTAPISSFGTIFLTAGFHDLSVLYFERFSQAELQISLANGAGVTNTGLFRNVTFAAPSPPTPVSEPASFAIFTLGLFGIGAKRLKRSTMPHV